MTQPDYRDVLETATEKVVEWMVNHGAIDPGPGDIDDNADLHTMMMGLRTLHLDGLEWFVGEATCDPAEPASYATDKELIVEVESEVPHHNLEIAALVPVESPVEEHELEAIVDEFDPGVVETYESVLPPSADYPAGECSELSVSLDQDHNDLIWVVRRLRFDEIDGPGFDAVMSAFVSLVRTTCRRIRELPNR